MDETAMLEKLNLIVRPIGIGDTKLELLSVENIEPILAELEKKGPDALKSFPYWIKIWEASIVLAAHLSEQDLDKNKTVIELGAGMGVVGFFLAAFGFPVTLSDANEDALKLMKKNASRNGLDTVAIKKLDWNNFESPGKYDIVCGAELVYRRSDIKSVLSAVETCVKPDGIVFLAHNIKQISMIDFLAEAGKFFDIEHAGKSMTIGDEKKQFVIHTMTKKTS